VTTADAPGRGALTAPALRPWQRLAVRLAVVFALLTVLTAGLVGALVHDRQKHELEDTVGTQLLNIARTGALLIDPAAQARLQRAPDPGSADYRRVEKALAAIRRETVLTTPIRTLADYDPRAGRARIVVTSGGSERPGEWFPVPPELTDAIAWSFEDGVARYTRIHRTPAGPRMSAVAPILDDQGRAIAVLDVDYPVDVFLDRLDELNRTIAVGTLAGVLIAVGLGVIVARRLTRPISALTGAVARVAGGDLALALPVRSGDEVGQLTRAFNEMVEGLRQRDFIRNAFGRYVSPEVARTLLESPDGLRLGGHKREITVLMSDLRGYTRFAEHGDPAGVMAVLNEYLGHMADIVIEHGGTINEFIGDAIFAVFGAPVEHADHAERAAAAALAMQRAMETLNDENVARGRPRFEMGIGIHTGEAVVGNIGSEQRAKYAVVGAAVNLAARVEGCTVGGQILLSTATVERLADLAETAPPVEVELKGLDAPIALHELRGLRGRFAQRLSERADAAADVALPVTGWRFEGKRVEGEPFAGTVRRLSRRWLEAALEQALPPLTNVRLRVTYDDARRSDDLYGKVTGDVARADAGLTRIHLTSVGPADAAVIDALVTSPAPSSAIGVSQPTEEPR
jgi:class 3 adenylate cyclase